MEVGGGGVALQGESRGGQRQGQVGPGHLVRAGGQVVMERDEARVQVARWNSPGRGAPGRRAAGPTR